MQWEVITGCEAKRYEAPVIDETWANFLRHLRLLSTKVMILTYTPSFMLAGFTQLVKRFLGYCQRKISDQYRHFHSVASMRGEGNLRCMLQSNEHIAAARRCKACCG